MESKEFKIQQKTRKIRRSIGHMIGQLKTAYSSVLTFGGIFFEIPGLDHEVESKCLQVSRKMEELTEKHFGDYISMTSQLLDMKKKVEECLFSFEDHQASEEDVCLICEEVEDELQETKLKHKVLLENLENLRISMESGKLKISKILENSIGEIIKKHFGNESKLSKILMDIWNTGKFEVEENMDSGDIENVLEFISTFMVDKLSKFDANKNKNITIKGIEFLGKIACHQENSLSSLDISKCDVGDDEFHKLVLEISKTPECVKLQKLRVNDNKLTGKGLNCLGNLLRVNDSLEDLDISGNREVGGIGFYNVAKQVILNESSNLRKLEFRETGNYDFSNSVFSNIQSDLGNHTNSSLEELDFKGCEFTGNSENFGIILSRVLNLKKLSFQNTGIRDSVLKAVLPQLRRLENLEELLVNQELPRTCRENDIPTITELGVKYIKDFQNQTPSLVKVNFSGNEIGDSGFTSITPGRVIDVDFQNCGISSKAEPHIRKIVENLEEDEDKRYWFCFAKNDLLNDNNELSSLFTHPSAVGVVLDNNSNLKNRGVRKLIPSLSSNTKISNFSMFNCGINSSVGDDFWKSVFGERNVEFINFGGNDLGLQGIQELTKNLLNLNTHPKDIRLSSIVFSEKMMIEFSKFLVNFKSKGDGYFDKLYLDFGDCKMTDDVGRVLFESIKHSKIRSLRLTNNMITIKSLKILLKIMIEYKKDFVVIFDGSDSSKHYEWAIFEWIDPSHFLSVDSIDEELIRLLLSRESVLENFVFRKSFIEEIRRRISIHKNNLEKTIIGVPRGVSLKLEISKMGITETNINGFIDTLMSKYGKRVFENLTSIDISHNCIEDGGIKVFSTKLLMFCVDLEELNVASCGLSDKGILEPITALNECKKFKKIILGGNKIEEGTLKRIEGMSIVAEGGSGFI